MKKCFIISFDIHELSRPSVVAALKSYGTWAKFNNSTWALVSDKSSKEIRDHLKSFLLPSDKLIVIKAGDTAAWRNFSTTTSDWLKKYIK